MTRTQSFLTGAVGALSLLVVIAGVAWAADIFTIDKDGTVRLVITDAGNVGIGTTLPDRLLNIHGSSGSPRVKVSSNNGVSVGVLLAQTAQTSWAIYQPPSSDDLRLWDGADRVAFKSGGNVGIGTTDPKTKLHVTGLPEYAGNAAALAAGLTAGAFYRTGELLKVVY